MGLFGRFFSTRSHASGVGSGRKIEVQSLGSRLVRLPALDHCGPYCRSPNRRYTLVWCDGVEGRGGARDGGDGRYVLLDDGKLVVDGHVQRPNDGKVADDGTFILNDWRFSNDLSGIFWAFRTDGSVILSRSFSANLLNNGLSEDGRFACCQTANASTEDGSVLAIFDLSTGKEISVFTPESGWASDYEFLPEIGTVRLLYAQEGDAFAYGLDGEFTEREKWVASRLDRGDIYMVKRSMDEVGNHPEPQLAARLLASIEAGLRRLDASDNYSLSLAWKLKGEILEALDMLQDALSAYERALTWNPKIGVKRHAERLKKALRRNRS